jgi:hypothetical protein
MAWTDPTLTSKIKTKAIHITELRSAIENLEAACATHNSTQRTYNATVNSTKYSTNNSGKCSTVKNHYSTVGCSVYKACVR